LTQAPRVLVPDILGPMVPKYRARPYDAGCGHLGPRRCAQSSKSLTTHPHLECGARNRL
jgi:hypothetical protein